MRTARAIRERSSGNHRMFFLLLIVGCGTGSLTAASPPGQGKAASERSIPDTAVAYDLKEISAFDVPEAVRPYFVSGQYVECQKEPNEQVKVYPKLQSAHPLYGEFVIGTLAQHRGPGPRYAFVLDESAGTGRGYDRLYLDLNRNGDLRDDGAKAPGKEPPRAPGFSSSSAKADVWFDPLALGLDVHDDPQRRLEVRPHLYIAGDGSESRAYIRLVGTKAHEGTIQVGDRKYQAILGHNMSISGWFDQPDTALHLLDADGPTPGRRAIWASRTQLQLSALHRQGNTFYCFAATPAGDKLFVWPYAGPFGTLEIGTGGRGFSRVSLMGSLVSAEAAVSPTEELGTARPQPAARSFRLPVGDYAPYMLSMRYDSLSCMVLHNDHADGRLRGRLQDSSRVYAIRIREDKPFVLDFSGKPQVLFALPARNLRLKPGSQLEVKAVLIDPALDIMFRSIRKGQRLDPKVVIKRANGEIVAEGTMPFG
jgi:hypothetical protein